MVIQDKLWKIKDCFEVNLLNVSPLNSAGEANKEVREAMQAGRVGEGKDVMEAEGK